MIETNRAINERLSFDSYEHEGRSSLTETEVARYVRWFPAAMAVVLGLIAVYGLYATYGLLP